MRIISGQARGRKLKTLEGLDTRPTLDRTREALFNILQQRVRDARVLDLFAGSGALALEALSRGAGSAVLCDQSPAACGIIRENIALVRMEDRARLLCCEASQALERLVGEQFDLIFLDPPYHKGLIDAALEGMIRRNQLAEGGLIVAETAQDEGFDLPEGLTFTDERKYGKSRLHFIERAWENHAAYRAFSRVVRPADAGASRSDRAAECAL